MLKDKLERLMKYKAKIVDRLSAPTPAKHLAHPESLKRFLELELAAVSRTIDEIRLEMTGK